MLASRRTRFQSRSSVLTGREGSRGEGKSKGLSARSRPSRMRRAPALSGTVRGPVFPSSRAMVPSLTSHKRSRTISLLRHPASKNAVLAPGSQEREYRHVWTGLEDVDLGSTWRQDDDDGWVHLGGVGSRILGAAPDSICAAMAAPI